VVSIILAIALWSLLRNGRKSQRWLQNINTSISKFLKTVFRLYLQRCKSKHILSRKRWHRPSTSNQCVCPSLE